MGLLGWMGRLSGEATLPFSFVSLLNGGQLKKERNWFLPSLFVPLRSFSDSFFSRALPGLQRSKQEVVVVVVLLFYVHGKHLRSCQDGQLT